MKQHTLQSSFSFESKGLHTGLQLHATFLPAEENTGIRICRTDLEGRPTYEAIADYVTATERGTVLERGAWKVSTVEHALSALYAMGVDNCLIEVDGPEMPILDGSAKYYIKAIQEVGLQEQDAQQNVFVVTEPIEYLSERGNKMLILPCDHYQAEVTITYPTGLLREQSAEIHNLSDYKRELSAARTFCFVREIEPGEIVLPVQPVQVFAVEQDAAAAVAVFNYGEVGAGLVRQLGRGQMAGALAGAAFDQAVFRDHQRKPSVGQNLAGNSFAYVPDLGQGHFKAQTGGAQFPVTGDVDRHGVVQI